uniref:G-protein coupled receptors family 3 profile domain-containing protein n=1 Tax=Xenopus tropicalis TaxID=8364 RepID=L7N375_XENTR
MLLMNVSSLHCRLMSNLYRTFLHLILICQVPASCSKEELNNLDQNGILVPGDILIGAVMPIHVGSLSSMATYHEKFLAEFYQHFQALRFALEEINGNPTLLPNKTLGFYVYDSCAALRREIEGTLWILTVYLTPFVHLCGHLYPQISYYSTSSLLSDRAFFPSFFRTVPSDAFQFRGLAKLVLHFKWTWVGLIATNDDYGNEAIKTINEEIIKGEACVAYTLYITSNLVSRTTTNIVNIIKESSANVVIAISVGAYLAPILEEMLKQNVTGKNFVASEAWSISNFLLLSKYSPLLSGTIGFAFQSSEIPGFQEYLNSINPITTPGKQWVQMLWEETFGCTFSDPTNQTFPMNNSKKPCTGEESLKSIHNGYNDVSKLRSSYNIYTAVHVIATALHDLSQCHLSNGTSMCIFYIYFFSFMQLLHYFKNVRVKLNSIECWKCPWDMWPNSARNKCFLKLTEFLSYEDPLGLILAAVSAFSSMVPMSIFRLFFQYKSTPIVRANNYSVSCILLVSLSFCFLCALAFIGYPQPEKCLLRQAAFGLVFTLCVSCILAKTVIVVFAFMATKPGSSLKKWTTPRVPYMIITICTFIQLTLCVFWLTIFPPFLQFNIEAKPGIIIVECNENSQFAFWCMLGYLGILASVSFTVAFLARRLPDNFNEAKLITFSMLAFLSVWVYFIPASLSAQGKYTVAMEIFAILTSSWALVFCMFLPKCFIILFRPDMNSREKLMGK